MHATLSRSLEFDRIRAALARLAATPLGRERADALMPASDPNEVRRALELTSEAMRFAGDGGSLAIFAPDDLPATLARLDIEDLPLEPLALLALGRTLASLDTIVRAIDRSGLPGLQAIAGRAASFADEVAAIERAIEPSGDISDHASPALREIRDALRRQRAKLRSSLESLTRGRDTAKYLQDQIVTDRNGRYVIVVRAEHREAIPGIVHGSSTSGASLYLEPLATVSLNNDVVALAERERAEIRRILMALTNAFRLRGDELAATVDTIADLDELHAKTELARRMDGVAPAITTDGALELRGARHPLLIPAVRDLLDEDRSRANAVVVPSDLVIRPPATALVISGPNTGGKTVALKAFGLRPLMAQAGLPIPVEAGSRLTPFASVFADIGDEQSIAASLSTFSAHIAKLVEMNQALELPALVLLDEVGSGTDPVEGGALGTAVVDHFRRRGAKVVATTHEDALKSYAATTDGVVTAGFGFDPDTYAPTYRLLYGAPGRSLAFEVAERLGMPAAVVADARARRSGRESQLAAHLARVDQEIGALERERQRLSSDADRIATTQRQLLERESRLAEREAVLKRRLDDRLNEKLREARAEVDKIVGGLKEKAATLVKDAEGRPAGRAAAISTGDVGRVRAEARAAIDDVLDAARGGTAEAAPAELDGPPEIGQTVLVASIGAEGIVRGVSSRHVDVEVRGKRMRVPAASLRPAARKEERPKATSAAKPSAIHRDLVDGPRATELMVIGSTVDDAIERTSKFLDDALLGEERRLRIVHGHGTGRLREALTKFLRAHPLVASVAQAPEREGGAGATIIELKD